MNNIEISDIDSKRSIFSYTDYRDFLRNLKCSGKADREEMTYQALANLAGLESRTKIKKILKGSMSIPKKSLELLGSTIGLSATEINFLNMLRMFNDTNNSDMALSFYSKIIQMQKKHLPSKENYKLEEKQLKLLEKWYYLPMLSYFDLKGKSSDTFEMVKAFKGQLTIEEVLKGIQLLVYLNLLTYTKDGSLETVHDTITLLDGIPRPLVKKFHSFMIQKAHDSVLGMPQEKRYLMSGTLTVKSSMIPEIKKSISQFMMKINDEYSVQDGDSLYQLNIQLFNLASIDPSNISASSKSNIGL